MSNIFPKIWERLDQDATLGALVQDINLAKNPDDPKKLNSPLVVLHTRGGPDVNGLHGAAVDLQLEVKIWGYLGGDTPGDMAKKAYQAADRIDLLLLEKFVLQDGSFTLRFRPATGWQDADQPDANVLHLINQYTARYWDQDRITAINGNLT